MRDSSSAADAKKMKSKKRKAVTKTEDITFVNSHKQGHLTIPCSTTISSSSLTIIKICFWGKDDFSGNINGYVVNITRKPKHKLTNKIKKLAAFDHNLLLHRHIEKDINETILTPVFSFPNLNSPIPLFYNTFATLGSFVYSIGGTYNHPEENIYRPRKNKNSKIFGSDLVYYFDTSDTYLDWKQAPPMLYNRQRPQVVAVNAKLYVFGCFGEERCPHKPRCVWAEFFDPSTGKWDILPVPKFKDCLVVLSQNITKMNKYVKKILVLADRKRVHKFDIEDNCWTLIVELKNDFDKFTRKPPVVVDNVLYWFENNAKAYDILKEETFEGPVQDFSFERAMRLKSKECNSIDDKPATIYLGGRYFCLLAYLPNLEEGNPRRIHCLVIKVSKTNQCYEQFCGEERKDIKKFFLGARVVSCQSFPIDCKMEFIDGRILMI